MPAEVIGQATGLAEESVTATRRAGRAGPRARPTDGGGARRPRVQATTEARATRRHCRRRPAAAAAAASEAACPPGRGATPRSRAGHGAARPAGCCPSSSPRAARAGRRARASDRARASARPRRQRRRRRPEPRTSGPRRRRLPGGRALQRRSVQRMSRATSDALRTEDCRKDPVGHRRTRDGMVDVRRCRW